MSLKYADAMELKRRWYEATACTCETVGVVPCASCVEFFRAHALGGWWKVAELLGDPPPQYRRSCCD